MNFTGKTTALIGGFMIIISTIILLLVFRQPQLIDWLGVGSIFVALFLTFRAMTKFGADDEATPADTKPIITSFMVQFFTSTIMVIIAIVFMVLLRTQAILLIVVQVALLVLSNVFSKRMMYKAQADIQEE